MNRTKIEWCDYTINPVKGKCPMACSYCYARRMYDRFKWNPEIRFDADAMLNCIPQKPSRIFVGSTMELFGDWVKPEWLEAIFDWTKICNEHTFIFLTKQPQNLIRWSPFPENCWIGISAISGILADAACAHLSRIEAKVKFISIEPFLEGWGEGNSIKNGRLGWQENYHDINWLIIGQQTPIRPQTMPKIEWVKEIVDAADKARVPVFLKNNLKEYSDDGTLRQEFPVLSRLWEEVVK